MVAGTVQIRTLVVHAKQQKSLLNLQRQLKKKAEGTRCRIKSKKEVERFNEESVQKL